MKYGETGMAMGTYNINVVSEDSGRIPIDVAGNVMLNVQRMLSIIGENSIRNALSLQGIVPDELLQRFILYVDSSSSSMASSADVRFDGHGSMLQDAMAELISVLDIVNKGIFSEFADKYPDPFCRNNILRCLSSLLEGLREYELSYSGGEKKGSLTSSSMKNSDMLWADVMCFSGEIVGVLKKIDDGMVLRTSHGDIPIECDGDDLIGIPCTVCGRVFLSEDGKAERIAEIFTLDKLEEMSFGRMISEDTDLVLSTNIHAEVGYDNDHDLWVLSSEPLGISITKENLDEAIMEFHDQFVFMWEVYYEGSAEGDEGEEFEEEELEVRDFIFSVVKEVGGR